MISPAIRVVKKTTERDGEYATIELDEDHPDADAIKCRIKEHNWRLMEEFVYTPKWDEYCMVVGEENFYQVEKEERSDNVIRTIILIAPLGIQNLNAHAEQVLAGKPN